MSAFSKKINFVLIFSVNMANPNGDPLSENIPRTTIDGRGWCTSECIRRKIRNRLQDLGYEIYVKSDDRCDDGCKDLKTRAEKAGMNKITDRNEFYKKACWNWFDVRTFGQVFAFNGFGIKSIGVRGPVTNSEAFSVLPVDIESVQITKSTSGEVKDKERGSDTMGMKHFVRHGVYVVKGSVSVNLAEKTGFTEEVVSKSSPLRCISHSLHTGYDSGEYVFARHRIQIVQRDAEFSKSLLRFYAAVFSVVYLICHGLETGGH